MIDGHLMEWLSLGLQFLVLPIFGMVWGVQGRLSKMEGEIKALYTILHLTIGKKEVNDNE